MMRLGRCSVRVEERESLHLPVVEVSRSWNAVDAGGTICGRAPAGLEL
jgi:hypothetical protein